MESFLGYSSRFPHRDRDECSRMCTETLERSNSWAPLGCRNCPTQTPRDVTAEELSACWSSSSPFAVIKYCDISSLRERGSLSACSSRCSWSRWGSQVSKSLKLQPSSRGPETLDVQLACSTFTDEEPHLRNVPPTIKMSLHTETSLVKIACAEAHILGDSRACGIDMEYLVITCVVFWVRWCEINMQIWSRTYLKYEMMLRWKWCSFYSSSFFTSFLPFLLPPLPLHIPLSLPQLSVSSTSTSILKLELKNWK